MQATIKGFFNPKHANDNFVGLNGSIEGSRADRIIRDPHEFLKAAGRDYRVDRDPVYQKLGEIDGVPQYAKVPDQYLLTRSTDKKVLNRKSVSDQYDILTLMDIADECKPWTDQGWATPDGVYSGREDSLEIFTLRLDAQGEIADEKFIHYVCFLNPFGTGKAQGKVITWRIVCANTFAAAVSASFDFAIAHKKGRRDEDGFVIKNRLAEAVARWERVQELIAEMAVKINNWKGISLTKSDMLELTTKLVIPSPEFNMDGTMKISGQAENKMSAILAAANNSRIGTYGKTAWDWLNGVTFVTSNGISSKSKVTATDRVIRNIDPAGTGFDLELRAKQLVG